MAKVNRPRYHSLARPKQVAASFLDNTHPNRRSTFWNDGVPLTDYNKVKKYGIGPLTKRQNELAFAKKMHPDYQADRSLSIWHPSPASLTTSPTKRVLELSRHKVIHPDYRPDKAVSITAVKKQALMAHPTDRINQLAQHKTYTPLDVRHRADSDWQNWEPGTPKAGGHFLPPSSRLNSLAKPKKIDEAYVPSKDDWGVSTESKNYIASDRIRQLAKPKDNHKDTEDYDPFTFMVSKAALMAQASPRINEISTPVPRKVRTKK